MTCSTDKSCSNSLIHRCKYIQIIPNLIWVFVNFLWFFAKFTYVFMTIIFINISGTAFRRRFERTRIVTYYFTEYQKEEADLV